MYMKADEVRMMLAIIRDHFDNAYVCMETLCPYFVKKENIENLFRRRARRLPGVRTALQTWATLPPISEK